MYWLLLLAVIGAGVWFIKAFRQSVRLAMRMEHLYQLEYDLERYTDRHEGKYPGNFEALLADGSGRPSTLASAYSGDTPATGPTTRALLNDFAQPGHLSYVYLGAGLTESTAKRDTVIAYEIPTDANEQTSMVLLGEHGIEPLDRRQTEALLRAVSSPTRPVRFTIPARKP